MFVHRDRAAPGPETRAYQRRIAELLDGFGDCFVVLDPDWRILDCNAAAERHFSAEPGALIGRALSEAAPLAAPSELARALTRALVEHVSIQGEAESDAFPGRWLAYRAFPVENGVAVGFRDISDQRDRRLHYRQQAEDLAVALARVEELESRHAFLLQLSDRLRALDDPDAILAAASAMIGERLDACRVGYAQMTPDDCSLVVGGNWTRNGVESYGKQLFPKEVFGKKAIQQLQAGKLVRVAEVGADRRTADKRATYEAMGVGAFIAVPLLVDSRMQATFTVMAEGTRTWSEEEERLVAEVAARTWTTLQRAQSERALRESEARFRQMADCAPSPVWVTSAVGEVEFVNQAYAASMEMRAHELIGHRWMDIIHPDERDQIVARRDEARANREAYTFEARMLHPEGQYRVMRVSSRPRMDDNGVFQGYVGMSFDVTDLRRAEARQNTLIQELNHRVKNTLATVQSIVHQILRRDSVHAETRRRITERLIALSSAHDVLTRQNWRHAGLTEVIREAIQPYTDPQAPRIELSGPSVTLSSSVAVALAMAFHELGSNAVRHGALSAPSGQVRITWRIAETGTLELEWRERGGPILHGPPSQTGFGSRLLQSLVSELGKPAEVEFTKTGLVCRLTAPIARI